MNEDLTTLNLIWLALSGVFIFLHGLLKLLMAFEIGKESLQQVFETVWKSIRQSRWQKMPETFISLTLNGKQAISEKLVNVQLQSQLYLRIALPMITIATPLMGYLYWGVWGIIGGGVAVALYLATLHDKRHDNHLFKNAFEWRHLHRGGPHVKLPRGLEFVWTVFPKQVLPGLTVKRLSYILSTVGFLVAAVVSVILLLGLDTHLAVLIALFLTPIYFLYIVFPFSHLLGLFMERSDVDMRAISLFGTAISISLVVTFASLSIGHLLAPDAPVPRSLQLVLSNLLFDGLTLMATFAILKWAIKNRSMLRIPFAIFVDIVVAAFFACCSLYLGLVFTTDSLSPTTVLDILLGSTPNGEVVLGPYFWLMHTAFLPTFAYITLILLAWLGKVLLVLTTLFFKKGSERDPLMLTYSLLMFVSATFAGIFMLTLPALRKLLT